MAFLITILRHSFELVLVTTALILVLAYLPHNVFPGFHVEPQSYDVPDLSTYLTGWNNVLGQKSHKLLNNQIIGPESIAQKDGRFYIGTADGRLLEVVDSETDSPSLRFVTRFAQPEADDCYDNEYHKLTRCGRPLGLRFDSRGYLVVADGMSGIWRVNVTHGAKKPLSKFPEDMKGIYNDFVMDPSNENILYVTISSTKWGLDRVPWSLLEHENSGLLVALDIKTGQITRLMDNLYFPNGIELSADNRYLLITECSNFGILKISLDQVRQVVSGGVPASRLQKEVFARNLPGEPDNIRLFSGNVYVAFAVTRAKGRTVSDLLSRLPVVRKAFARFCFLISRLVYFVRNILWSHPALEETEFLFSSGHVVYNSLPTTSAIAVLDGKTGAFKGLMGSEQFAFISEAIIDERNGDMYFGSFRNKFLGRISAKDITFS